LLRTAGLQKKRSFSAPSFAASGAAEELEFQPSGKAARKAVNDRNQHGAA